MATRHRMPAMPSFLRAALAAAAIISLSTPGAGGRTESIRQTPPRGLKVFISVDMEGLAGVVAGNEVSTTGPDYAHFRAIMAAETNAAIDGAARAGATEFVVRDSHGNKTNLLPSDVSPRAHWCAARAPDRKT